MSPALQAHLRLLAQLPRREHRREYSDGRAYTAPRDAIPSDKVQRMAELEEAGKSRGDIAKELGVCRATVTNRLGPQKVRRYR